MLERVRKRMAAGQPIVMVSYGDSISEVGRTPGYYGGASHREKNWASRLRNLLAEAYPKAIFDLRHFGHGGHNSYEGLGRFDYLKPIKPDLVLLEFGSNDYEPDWHPIPPESTRMAMYTLIEWTRGHLDADVVVLGFAAGNPLGNSDEREQFVAATQAAIRAVAEETKAPWVDIRSAVLKATDGGKNWAQFHEDQNNVHPTDAGHEVWARTVLETLLREIGQVD